jgi:hypothetical protein
MSVARFLGAGPAVGASWTAWPSALVVGRLAFVRADNVAAGFRETERASACPTIIYNKNFYAYPSSPGVLVLFDEARTSL